MSSVQPTAASGAQLPQGARPLDAETDPARRQARQHRRAVARLVRQGIVALLVAGAAVATVVALRPRPVPIDAAAAGRGALAVIIEESGSTRVTDRYTVSAPVTGSLSRVVFEPGDAVSQGDVLARIVPTLSPLLDDRARVEAEARLGASLSALGQARALALRAAAARDQAGGDLERTRQLFASGALARQPLDQSEFESRMRDQELSSAQFATKVAEEEVRAARAALRRDSGGAAPDRYADVLAPASGRVLRVHQKSAGVVQAGAPILEVGDPAALEAVVDLLTTDAVHVQQGTPVSIEGWGGEGALAGRVRRIEPSAFTRPSALGVDEQRVNVIVAPAEPGARWAALADGYRVQARFVLWRAGDVVKVPQGAVFRRGDGWGAFRVDAGVAHLVAVSIGHRGETEVEIASGLSPGDRVVVHAGDRVKDGVRVEER